MRKLPGLQHLIAAPLSVHRDRQRSVHLKATVHFHLRNSERVCLARGSPSNNPEERRIEHPHKCPLAHEHFFLRVGLARLVPEPTLRLSTARSPTPRLQPRGGGDTRDSHARICICSAFSAFRSGMTAINFLSSATPWSSGSDHTSIVTHSGCKWAPALTSLPTPRSASKVVVWQKSNREKNGLFRNRTQYTGESNHLTFST